MPDTKHLQWVFAPCILVRNKLTIHKIKKGDSNV